MQHWMVLGALRDGPVVNNTVRRCRYIGGWLSARRRPQLERSRGERSWKVYPLQPSLPPAVTHTHTGHSRWEEVASADHPVG